MIRFFLFVTIFSFITSDGTDMVAKWPKHVGEIFRVLDNTYVLMCL